MLAKLNSNRIRHSNEHEIWLLFASTTILCSARFAVVNVCVNALDSRNVNGMLLQLSLCSPTPQGVHVLTAALSHQAYGCKWLLKNYDSALRSYTDRWCMRKSTAEDCLFQWPELPSLIFMWLPLPQTQLPLISPASDLFCAVTEECQPPEDLGCRVSVGPRCSVMHLHGCVICSQGWNMIE